MWWATLGATLTAAAPLVSVTNRAQPIYDNVTSKLRVQGSGFSEGSTIELTLTPTMPSDDYKITVVSETQLSLGLKPGKAWPKGPDYALETGSALYLVQYKSRGMNLLDTPVVIAQVFETPTVMHGGDKMVYMTGTKQFNINGTGFRQKFTELTFDPPLIKDLDYMLNIRSSTFMQLTLKTGKKWRDEPGPLKLKFIDTGAGKLRIDAKYGGVTVTEVQADLGPHGVTVETSPEVHLYQSSQKLIITGNGFNTSTELNTLRWGNSLRGKGLNYTITESSKTSLTLSLTPNSKWRANPLNLPGPLTLLAVNAGAGLVPVGPTEVKKGRVVATIYEDPVIDSRYDKTIYMTHTHELWITGKGFTSGTQIEFDPPLAFGTDYISYVNNRTHMLIQLMDNAKWAPTSQMLRVTSVDTGAGKVRDFTPVNVAMVANDADFHESGLSVTRTNSQTLYQSTPGLIIAGTGFCSQPQFTFDPPLQDYTVVSATEEQVSLSLTPGKKWHPTGGNLMVTQVSCGTPVQLAYGQGINVASILPDPYVEKSDRKIYTTHTKKLVIQGSGFTQTPRITLKPTLLNSYDVEEFTSGEVVLALKEGKSWLPPSTEEGTLTVTAIDTGAGPLTQDVDVAKVFADVAGVICDDSCEWALDGMCDDGSTQSKSWQDDDYGGFYAYDDDYYSGYGYYYEDDYDYRAPVCDRGTDCTDCSATQGPDDLKPAVECDNSCQWSWDSYCDDTRTSGLCDLGTDCHDCGPASSGNYTKVDDDGWWDDDEEYWDDEYDFEGFEMTDDLKSVAFVKSTPNPKTTKAQMTDPPGIGGIFMLVLEGLVVAIGFVMCSIGVWFAYRYFKGEKLPFELVPADDPYFQDDSSSKKSLAITPDVTYSGNDKP